MLAVEIYIRGKTLLLPNNGKPVESRQKLRPRVFKILPEFIATELHDLGIAGTAPNVQRMRVRYKITSCLQTSLAGDLLQLPLPPGRGWGGG